MKKFIILGLILLVLSAAASAQIASGDNFRRHRVERNFDHRQLTRPERFQLRRDHLRYERTRRHALRDGRIGPLERRRLHHIRRHNRHEVYRFRHNRFHRVI